MRYRLLSTGMILACASLLAGCTDQAAVREYEIHIGWSHDGKSQYMTPNEIRVEKGDRVRFVVYNDDDPTKDYNGDKGGKDSFHDVALLDYDGDGDGIAEDIEHEVPPGQVTKTCLPQASPSTKCQPGKDYFTAKTVGSFRIICEVRTQPSHETLGMKASFIVD